MEQQNFVLIISSPSGAGKTSIVNSILQNDNKFVPSISATTRKKRSLETEGKDYFFVNKEKFDEMLKDDQFIEHAEVFGNLYGSPKKYLFKKLNDGFDVLFDIDWQGARSLEQRLGKKLAVSIFILPPSMKELERRLKARNQDHEEEIYKRLNIARFEIEKYPLYDYVLINDNLEETLKNIETIIKAERLKRVNLEKFTRNLFL